MNERQNSQYGFFPRPCMAGEIIYVQGEEQARSYPGNPGETLRFMDVSGKWAYIKAMPYNPQMPYTFQRIKMVYEPIEESQLYGVDRNDFVTQDQLNAVANKLDLVLERLENRRGKEDRKYDERKQPNGNSATGG